MRPREVATTVGGKASDTTAVRGWAYEVDERSDQSKRIIGPAPGIECERNRKVGEGEMVSTPRPRYREPLQRTHGAEKMVTSVRSFQNS